MSAARSRGAYLAALESELRRCRVRGVGDVLAEVDAHIDDVGAALLDAGVPAPEVGPRAIATMAEPATLAAAFRAADRSGRRRRGRSAAIYAASPMLAAAVAAVVLVHAPARRPAASERQQAPAIAAAASPRVIVVATLDPRTDTLISLTRRTAP
jgi:hypothetical protein